MSLFGDSNDQTPEEEAAQPSVKPTKPNHIQPASYKGITIDTQYVPRSTMLQWIEGSLYTVNYYSQVLGEHDEPKPLAHATSPVYQQYRMIRQMDLKITSPISPSVNPQDNTAQVTGSGITYPFLVPQKGDMFVADVGDGQVGLFTITQATQATIRKDSVYMIEFLMVNELRESDREDLDRKTIETFHFSRESLISGAGPFVTETHYQRQGNYATLRDELITRYMSDFYSRQYTTLIVPDQSLVTYDHFVAQAVRQIVSGEHHPIVRKIRALPVATETVMSRPTLWDAIIRHQPNRLILMTNQVKLVSTQIFNNRPILQSLNHTGIKRIVFPLQAPSNVDAYYGGKHERDIVGVRMEPGKPRYQEGPLRSQMERNLPWFQPSRPATINPDDSAVPMASALAAIHPVTKDAHYVLSEAFYLAGRRHERSCLEVVMDQVLQAKPISHEHLDEVLKDIWEWDNLERFYYYPLVWMALTMGVRY